MANSKRPTWAMDNPLMQQYYDLEWGIELHDERALFEMLCLETYQAGLSWQTVLNKRDDFRAAFHNYDIDRVAQMSAAEIGTQLQNKKIIRNRLKLNATVNNAQVIVRMHDEGKTFNDYIWQFVDRHPQRLVVRSDGDLPAQTRLSVQVSKQMKKDRFKFVGPVTIYSYLLAVGVVNARLAD
ncbi:DNA-3-methyladenine glycosylase I [Paucilactobacillus wasatchensis]|uniref:DNA-3-methyladenine glycosylase n=1 Tax=Paucilactobacillus wasatchensis TaxID=1335616 RepID=A0A0D1A9E2_9LACO|nr:DNA-3-methyladenine glycosylase I [Paucilactobacillus wasatchensis]KIS03361.1 DNA-3-methyladenine glycosylase [Paucilactobacillus wasatchensis]